MPMFRVLNMMSLVGLTMAVTVGCSDAPPTDTPAANTSARATAPPATPAATQSSSGQTQPATEAVVGPEKIVNSFLEAVRTGDDQTAAAMLTPLAIERTSEHQLKVAPTGSPTAQFTIGEVDFIEGGGAHVASTWSDVIDDQGNRRTDTLVWMLRREQTGWRIAGLGAVVIEGEPPLFLNFEDPEDMDRKQKLTEEELTRRAAEAESAQNAATSPNSAATARQAQLPQQPIQRRAQLPPNGTATPRR